MQSCTSNTTANIDIKLFLNFTPWIYKTKETFHEGIEINEM